MSAVPDLACPCDLCTAAVARLEALRERNQELLRRALDDRQWCPDPPYFPSREAAAEWLARAAAGQARRNYGPDARTSIGRCRSIRILCNYLRLPPSAVRWSSPRITPPVEESK